MNDQAIRFRIGIFVLGALILLAVLIMLFGGFPNYFKPANHYTITFANAKGVAPGTPVRRSGVKIGEVRKVNLDNETGLVAVDIRVDPKYTIRKGDQPTLVQGLLGGDSSIDFLPPAPDGKAPDAGPVPPGAKLEGSTQPGTSTLFQQASELMPPAQETLKEMQKTMKAYEKLTPLLEETLKEYRDIGKATRDIVPELRKTNDEFQLSARNWGKLAERLDVLVIGNEEKMVKALDQLNLALRRINAVFSEENQRNLDATLKNVRTGSERLDSISRNTDELMKESRVTIKRINDSLIRSEDVLANLQKTTKPMAERSESILRNMEESTDKLNRILGDTREILGSITRQDGTLQRLLTDPNLYHGLSETVHQVNRLLPRMDRVLRDVEIFADKIARHPEALGVGGAIRPGTGLKEPPTVLPWRGPPPGH
jgi:phospholipid/cholesterol/gamma-HCH transport system substrate-binding protein